MRYRAVVAPPSLAKEVAVLIVLGVVLGLAGLALLLGLVSVDLYAVGDDRLGLLLLVAAAVVMTVSFLRSGVFSRGPPGS